MTTCWIIFRPFHQTSIPTAENSPGFSRSEVEIELWLLPTCRGCKREQFGWRRSCIWSGRTTKTNWFKLLLLLNFNCQVLNLSQANSWPSIYLLSAYFLQEARRTLQKRTGLLHSYAGKVECLANMKSWSRRTFDLASNIVREDQGISINDLCAV